MASSRAFRQLLRNVDVLASLRHSTPHRCCCMLSTSPALHHTQRLGNSDTHHTKLTSLGHRFDTYTQVRHKGHSHFQNIRANKMANDNAKMQVASKMSSELAVAVREGGSADPKLNGKLANVISKAMGHNITKDKIFTALEKIKEAGKNLQNTIVEVRGPMGSVFVVDLFSLNPNTAKNTVKSVMKKIPGAKVADHTSWMRLFDQVGVITVPVTAAMDAGNLDTYVEVAIEVGAEDVILVKNEDEEIEAESVLKFHCDHRLVSKIEKEISEGHDLKVSSAEVELVPHVWVQIESPDDVALCEAILTRLHKLEELVKVSDNITLPDE